MNCFYSSPLLRLLPLILCFYTVQSNGIEKGDISSNSSSDQKDQSNLHWQWCQRNYYIVAQHNGKNIKFPAKWMLKSTLGNDYAIPAVCPVDEELRGEEYFNAITKVKVFELKYSPNTETAFHSLDKCKTLYVETMQDGQSTTVKTEAIVLNEEPANDASGNNKLSDFRDSYNGTKPQRSVSLDNLNSW